MFAAGHARAQGTPAVGEYEVKAAFVFNFLRYVAWPEDASAPVCKPLTIAILGEDPFGKSIRRLSTRSVQGRPVAVRHCRSLQEVQTCALLFVCASEVHRLDTILKSAEDLPILVVGDTPGFAEAGGTVELYVEGTQIHFKVNIDAAKRSGLEISSKLLRLAEVVRRR